MSVLSELAACKHPIHRIAQCPGHEFIMQWCGDCGACRMLSGRGGQSWQKAGLVEAAMNVESWQKVETKTP